MKTTLKWLLYTAVAFLVISAFSYHDETDHDGSLGFGIPLVIYHKAVRVLLVETNEIGQSEQFYTWHLVVDIIFASVVALLFVVTKRWLKNRRSKKQDSASPLF